MTGLTSEHLTAMAAKHGTPLYVYDAALIRERYRALGDACGAYPHDIHYAIKANATLAIVRLMRACGACADANSGGEIEVALRAGFAPKEIVFTGVGKTGAEIERAVTLGVKAINAESPGEVERIASIAERHPGAAARVAIRINPDVDAESHPHISTGLRTNKFGMSIDAARALAREIGRHPSLRIVGLHVHIGSQITKTAPLARAAEALAGLATELMTEGVKLEHLDVGGGLGIPYQAGQPVVSPSEYVAAILPPIRKTGLRLVLEPGRWIVGPAGVLVTTVVDLKEQPADPKSGEARWFVIADAGMTDLLRPALYGAWHDIAPVNPRPGDDRLCDIVGPVCETTDTLGSARRLPPVEVGDLLVVRDAGAYGSVMASNYNRRAVPAEVMDGRLIRRRQTIEDLLQWDV
ncbi:MAG: diaminopimelate decarboxylase [Acidobacteria bacterium]|nr:MAG: diaminopimelate decarboxylase [Acidobacteriota bacterium]